MAELKIKPKSQTKNLVQGFAMSQEHIDKIVALATYYGVNKSEIIRAMIDATDIPKGGPKSA